MAVVTSVPFPRSAVARLERATPRERMLGLALAAALLVGLVVVAQTWAQSQSANVAADGARLADLVQADDAGRLRAVDSRLRALDAKVRGWSLPAPSFATARVLAEQEVAVAAAQAGLTALDVRSAETADLVGGVRWVRVELAGDFAWGGLARLTRALASSGHGYVAESIAVGDESPARLKLVLLAPVAASPVERR